MYVAYSALRAPEQMKTIDELERSGESERLERYRAYLDACQKHSQHLQMIQQYMPGWMPRPPAP
jgi:Na+/phosphate symporter